MLPVTLLGLLAGALGSPALPLQREEALLATGIKVVDFLTDFLGYDGPKKYLLIGQNDDEVRATGVHRRGGRDDAGRGETDTPAVSGQHHG